VKDFPSVPEIIPAEPGDGRRLSQAKHSGELLLAGPAACSPEILPLRVWRDNRGWHIRDPAGPLLSTQNTDLILAAIRVHSAGAGLPLRQLLSDWSPNKSAAAGMQVASQTPPSPPSLASLLKGSPLSF